MRRFEASLWRCKRADARQVDRALVLSDQSCAREADARATGVPPRRLVTVSAASPRMSMASIMRSAVKRCEGPEIDTAATIAPVASPIGIATELTLSMASLKALAKPLASCSSTGRGGRVFAPIVRITVLIVGNGPDVEVRWG